MAENQKPEQEEDAPPPPPGSPPGPPAPLEPTALPETPQADYSAQYAAQDPSQAYYANQEAWQAYEGNAAYEEQGQYAYYAGCFTEQAPAMAPAPPAKRQRLDNDSIAAALIKIKGHVGNPKKFMKAAPLLRQLFTENKLSGAHGDLVFECLKAAMADISFHTCQQLDLRKEYVKLFTIASKYAQIFSAREKSQLDVYGLIAVLRNQLQTDDSFVLNRILSRIKDSISHLPKVTEEDNATLKHLQECQAEQNTLHPVAGESPEGGGLPTAECEGSTWSDSEILCMKREALVLCLEAAQQLHSKLWGRTSVEIAYEDAQKHRDRFCEPQQLRIDTLARFARNERTARQQGKSTAAANRRDQTAFEAARREWSKVSGISSRGKVGAQGDHGTEVWLG